MKRFAKSAVVLSGFALAVTGAIAAGDPIKERQELMKTVGKSVKLTAGMVKGEAFFEADKAAEAMQTVAAVPDKFITLFPADSDKGDTRAAPKIWQEKAKFDQAAGKLKAAATALAAAASKGEDQFKAGFGALIDACKGCHQDYRLEKKK